MVTALPQIWIAVHRLCGVMTLQLLLQILLERIQCLICKSILAQIVFYFSL